MEVEVEVEEEVDEEVDEEVEVLVLVEVEVEVSSVRQPQTTQSGDNCSNRAQLCTITSTASQVFPGKPVLSSVLHLIGIPPDVVEVEVLVEELVEELVDVLVEVLDVTVVDWVVVEVES